MPMKQYSIPVEIAKATLKGITLDAELEWRRARAAIEANGVSQDMFSRMHYLRYLFSLSGLWARDMQYCVKTAIELGSIRLYDFILCVCL